MRAVFLRFTTQRTELSFSKSSTILSVNSSPDIIPSRFSADTRLNRSYISPAFERISLPFSPISKQGCVAVHNTTVQPYCSTNNFNASLQGVKNSRGSICASSNIITLFAILCNLRNRPGLCDNKDSKNCTFVDKIIGESQFSTTHLRYSSSEPKFSFPIYSVKEWFSTILLLPNTDSYTSAFCSIIDVYGIQ